MWKEGNGVTPLDSPVASIVINEKANYAYTLALALAVVGTIYALLFIGFNIR
jgi:hypothetical protein